MMANHRPSSGTDDWVRKNVDWIVGLLVIAVIVLSVVVWRMNSRIDCLEVAKATYETNTGLHIHDRCP